MPVKIDHLIAAGTLLFLTQLTQAAPLGGGVVSGSGHIIQSNGMTTIEQTSPNLSLNWSSFNIAAGETVLFKQPDALSIAINHILDTHGSQILGHLNANGQVWLINPNGILFGQGAQVNVGGLIASTLNLDESTFNSRIRSFSGSGTGKIINQGAINAADGGYVALLGNQVSNQGVIAARLGTVALAGGNATTLTFSDNHLVQMQVDQSTLNNLAENKQLIQADGGQVIMTAGAKNALLSSVVNNTGIIEARTVENHQGVITLSGGETEGQVTVGGLIDVSSKEGKAGQFTATAGQVLIDDQAKIDATGGSQGGFIQVGSGAFTKEAYVSNKAQLDASATDKGDGGQISIGSDLAQPGSITSVHGALLAKGGRNGGDGGTIETSGGWLDVTGIKTDVSAPLGRAGSWLLSSASQEPGALLTVLVQSTDQSSAFVEQGSSESETHLADASSMTDSSSTMASSSDSVLTPEPEAPLTLASNSSEAPSSDQELSFDHQGHENQAAEAQAFNEALGEVEAPDVDLPEDSADMESDEALPPAKVKTLATTLASAENPASVIDSWVGNHIQSAVDAGVHPMNAHAAGGVYGQVLAVQLSHGVSMAQAVWHAEQAFNTATNFAVPSPPVALALNLASGDHDVGEEIKKLSHAETASGSAAFDQALAASLAKGMDFSSSLAAAQAAAKQSDALSKADNSSQSKFANGDATKLLDNRSDGFQKAVSGLMLKGYTPEQAMKHAAQWVDDRPDAHSALTSGRGTLKEMDAGIGRFSPILSSALAQGVAYEVALKRVGQIEAAYRQGVALDAQKPAAGFANGRELPKTAGSSFNQALVNEMSRGQSLDQAVIGAEEAVKKMPKAKPSVSSALATGVELELSLGKSRTFETMLGNLLARGMPLEQALNMAKHAADAKQASDHLPTQMTIKVGNRKFDAVISNAPEGQNIQIQMN